MAKRLSFSNLIKNPGLFNRSSIKVNLLICRIKKNVVKMQDPKIDYKSLIQILSGSRNLFTKTKILLI